MNSIKILLALIILAGCTSTPEQSSKQNDKLFPDGIYRQRVELEILKDGEVKAGFPFSSVSRVENGSFEVLGLTPFGTSAFEAKGHLDHPDQLEIKFFITPPAFLKKSFIKESFGQINSLYKLNESDLTKKEDRDFYKNEILEMEIFKYNKQSIPTVMKLRSEKWRVYVQTQSYQKLN